MKRLTILLSFDHELSLGGVESYERDLFAPTDQLLDLAAELSVPITLFTDVCAALRFREWDRDGFFMPYVRQIQRAIAQSHDVQLHVHPHWMTSDFRHGRFVPSPMYALGYFIDHPWPNNIPGIIERGIGLLHELCRPQQPDYKCLAFRAGGFCLTPETGAILSALYHHGIRIESSIAKGNYVKFAGCLVDHHEMPRRANWFIPKEGPLHQEAEDGLYEIPIAARPRTPWNNLPFLFKRLLYRGRRYRSKGWPFDRGRTSFSVKIKRLIPNTVWMLGFDNYTHSLADLMRILHHHVSSHADETVICSALSHPKHMGGYARELMVRFVEQVRQEYTNQVTFCTYRAIYDNHLATEVPA